MEIAIVARVTETARRVRWIGLAGGPAVAAAVFLAIPAAELGYEGRCTAAVAAWMAVWWMTEAIDVAATALLPVALLPALGAAPIGEVTAPYGHPLIFLFIGGYAIALAMQRWGLHERLALSVLRVVGTRPRAMVGGFMLITAALSMWVSNTATTAMMLPIAISVVGLVPAGASHAPERRFAVCLLLGIAYAASIGGIGTLIGSPTNLVLAGYMRDNLHRPVQFVDWMKVGMPVVLVFLPVAWWLLTSVLFPVGDQPIEGGAQHIRDRYRALGAVKRGEWVTLAVFCAAALAWVLRPVIPIAGLSDAGIAIAAALILFAVPVDVGGRVFALDWATMRELPWGTLLLFGGGLSLAAAIDATGVGDYLGEQVRALAGATGWVLAVCVTAIVVFLTELTSNTATTAALVPILARLAPALGADPLQLIVPTAVAASCAFMLPVATPPNAIVFGTGHVGMRDMMRAGLWLNILGIAIVSGLTLATIEWAFGQQ